MVSKTASEILEDRAPLIDTVTNDLAFAYSKSSSCKKSIPLYEKVIERKENFMANYGSLTFDEKRKIISDNSSTYVNVADLYYRDNNFKDAFRILERGRSRLLINVYSKQLAKNSDILDDKDIISKYPNLIISAP